jgi:hypothetical protein
VGSTDLEVEFVVLDEVTGTPIPGARLDIQSEGGFCDEGKRQEFRLVSGLDGRAKRLCKECMCFGTSGWKINTYVVHLPCWFYHASADGYNSSDKAELDVQDNVRRVQRAKPAARLVIKVLLQKAGP